MQIVPALIWRAICEPRLDPASRRSPAGRTLCRWRIRHRVQIVIVKGLDAHHGAENFSRTTRMRRFVREHGRLDKIATIARFFRP